MITGRVIHSDDHSFNVNVTRVLCTHIAKVSRHNNKQLSSDRLLVIMVSYYLTYYKTT